MEESTIDRILKLNNIDSQDENKMNILVKNATSINIINILRDNIIDDSEIKLLRILIKNGADINFQNEDKNIALIIASRDGNLETVKFLIENGANINFEDQDGANYTPLMEASLYGNLEIVKFLVENGANINFQNKSDRSALINASESDNLEIVKVLVKNEANIDIQGGDNALMYASLNDNLEMVKVLIEYGSNVNFQLKDDSDTLKYALKNNNLEIVKVLIEHGVNNFKTSDLIVACRNLNFEMIKLLVNNGVEVNKQFYNPLKNRDAHLKSYFEEHPLKVVCSNSYVHYKNKDKSAKITVDIAKFLINNGANVNIDSPLMACCLLEDSGMFITDEDPIDKRDRNINIEMIKLLIENGADVNYKNNETILMKATKISNGYDLITILIENGVDINELDNNNNSVLFHLDNGLVMDNFSFLCSESLEGSFNEKQETLEKFGIKEIYHSEKIMKLLIENGANLNIKNNLGMTPLMHYTVKGEDRLIKILVDSGADINIKSEMTAYDLTTKQWIKDIIKSLSNNNPQKLVKILTNFTEDKPMKFTTHNWDFGDLYKSTYKNFDGYMNAVKVQWDSIKNDLKISSPNLYKKVYNFLWETDPTITIGWSSIDGLKQWCNDGNNPFDFKNFKEIVYNFKKEIEIRKENNILENIFGDIEEALDDKYEDVFIFELKKLQGVTFYTDTEKFQNAINIIFNQISEEARHKYPNITVECIGDSTKEFIELKITQIGSVSQSSAKVMLEEINNGDFASIKENLTNLCDWSIESSFENTNYRINYLKSNNIKDIEELEYKPLGFTHILRFYNK